MSDSHFTCESRSILTRTCRKPMPVAFALHLSIDGSATYSGIGETLCARRSGGSHEALAFGGNVGMGCQAPGRCVRPAAAADRCICGGTVISNALAVLRLMTNSSFTACWTGRSADLAPLRILPA